MAQRCPMGALEGDILDILWRADTPVTRARSATTSTVDWPTRPSPRSTTTITTILTRLVDKGLVQRTRQGRGYTYAATVSEAGLTATRMRSAPVSATDRVATMSRFVDGFSAKEAAALRAALERLEA